MRRIRCLMDSFIHSHTHTQLATVNQLLANFETEANKYSVYGLSYAASLYILVMEFVGRFVWSNGLHCVRDRS